MSVTAISIGKNKIKTGVSIVPNPNPEKNVSNDPEKAAIQMTTTSILLFNKYVILSMNQMYYIKSTIKFIMSNLSFQNEW
ncbi:MAG: hypothetical protein IPO92_12800 [Saprospiraceae bacterium]|nr:hypothetical protein [Saprospiraceae bacterium]